MANVNFYLKSVKPNKKGEVPILVQVTLDYKKIRKQIERIKKKYWNPNKQRVRPSRPDEPYNRHIEINSLLDHYDKRLKDFFNDCLKHRIELDEDITKDFLDGKEVIKRKNPKFFEAFTEFIKTKKVEAAERTVTGYTTVQNFLFNFQTDMDFRIAWNNIDISFFDKLKYYAFSVKDVSDNYFAKIVAVLKNFLNWSSEREYTNNNSFKKFSYAEKEKEIIFLTADELFHLFYFDFKSERLSKARDIYCFGCFTGLRISDINQLKHEHISDNTIFKKIQKTGKIERIPLNKFALEILSKYKDNPVLALPKLSKQKFNKYIKECCEKAEINRPVSYIEYRAGKAIEITKPKHELITSHTATKTFVTNSLILGMNVKAIKDITGHKKDSTFNKYLKVVEDFKRSELDRAWNNIKIK